jgi:hypothetical protein
MRRFTSLHKNKRHEIDNRNSRMMDIQKQFQTDNNNKSAKKNHRRFLFSNITQASAEPKFTIEKNTRFLNGTRKVLKGIESVVKSIVVKPSKFIAGVLVADAGVVLALGGLVGGVAVGTVAAAVYTPPYLIAKKLGYKPNLSPGDLLQIPPIVAMTPGVHLSAYGWETMCPGGLGVAVNNLKYCEAKNPDIDFVCYEGKDTMANHRREKARERANDYTFKDSLYNPRNLNDKELVYKLRHLAHDASHAEAFQFAVNNPSAIDDILIYNTGRNNPKLALDFAKLNPSAITSWLMVNISYNNPQLAKDLKNIEVSCNKNRIGNMKREKLNMERKKSEHNLIMTI